MPYSIIISKMSTTLNLNKPLRIHNLYPLHISSRNTLTARLKFLITRTTSETFATFFFQECQYASLVESIILTWCVTLVYAGSGISVQNTLLLITKQLRSRQISHHRFTLKLHILKLLLSETKTYHITLTVLKQKRESGEEEKKDRRNQ